MPGSLIPLEASIRLTCGDFSRYQLASEGGLTLHDIPRLREDGKLHLALFLSPFHVVEAVELRETCIGVTPSESAEATGDSTVDTMRVQTVDPESFTLRRHTGGVSLTTEAPAGVAPGVSDALCASSSSAHLATSKSLCVAQTAGGLSLTATVSHKGEEMGVEAEEEGEDFILTLMLDSNDAGDGEREEETDAESSGREGDSAETAEVNIVGRDEATDGRPIVGEEASSVGKTQPTVDASPTDDAASVTRPLARRLQLRRPTEAVKPSSPEANIGRKREAPADTVREGNLLPVVSSKTASSASFTHKESLPKRTITEELSAADVLRLCGGEVYILTVDTRRAFFKVIDGTQADEEERELSLDACCVRFRTRDLRGSAEKTTQGTPLGPLLCTSTPLRDSDTYGVSRTDLLMAQEQLRCLLCPLICHFDETQGDQGTGENCVVLSVSELPEVRVASLVLDEALAGLQQQQKLLLLSSFLPSPLSAETARDAWTTAGTTSTMRAVLVPRALASSSPAAPVAVAIGDRTWVLRVHRAEQWRINIGNGCGVDTSFCAELVAPYQGNQRSSDGTSHIVLRYLFLDCDHALVEFLDTFLREQLRYMSRLTPHWRNAPTCIQVVVTHHSNLFLAMGRGVSATTDTLVFSEETVRAALERHTVVSVRAKLALISAVVERQLLLNLLQKDTRAAVVNMDAGWLDRRVDVKVLALAVAMHRVCTSATSSALDAAMLFQREQVLLKPAVLASSRLARSHFPFAKTSDYPFFSLLMPLLLEQYTRVTYKALWIQSNPFFQSQLANPYIGVLTTLLTAIDSTSRSEPRTVTPLSAMAATILCQQRWMTGTCFFSLPPPSLVATAATSAASPYTFFKGQISSGVSADLTDTPLFFQTSLLWRSPKAVTKALSAAAAATTFTLPLFFLLFAIEHDNSDSQALEGRDGFHATTDKRQRLHQPQPHHTVTRARLLQVTPFSWDLSVVSCLKGTTQRTTLMIGDAAAFDAAMVGPQGGCGSTAAAATASPTAARSHGAKVARKRRRRDEDIDEVEERAALSSDLAAAGAREKASRVDSDKPQLLVAAQQLQKLPLVVFDKSSASPLVEGDVEYSSAFWESLRAASHRDIVASSRPASSAATGTGAGSGGGAGQPEKSRRGRKSKIPRIAAAHEEGAADEVDTKEKHAEAACLVESTTRAAAVLKHLLGVCLVAATCPDLVRTTRRAVLHLNAAHAMHGNVDSDVELLDPAVVGAYRGLLSRLLMEGMATSETGSSKWKSDAVLQALRDAPAAVWEVARHYGTKRLANAQHLASESEKRGVARHEGSSASRTGDERAFSAATDGLSYKERETLRCLGRPEAVRKTLCESIMDPQMTGLLLDWWKRQHCEPLQSKHEAKAEVTRCLGPGEFPVGPTTALCLRRARAALASAAEDNARVKAENERKSSLFSTLGNSDSGGGSGGGPVRLLRLGPPRLRSSTHSQAATLVSPTSAATPDKAPMSASELVSYCDARCKSGRADVGDGGVAARCLWLPSQMLLLSREEDASRS